MQWTGNKTPETSQALLTSLQPTIDKAITTYVGPTPSPTIRGRAKLMALQAAEKFSPRYGAALPTHVFSQLQSLRRYAGQENMILRQPERLMLDRNHLDKVSSQLRDELGRDPNDDELAARSGFNRQRISRSRGLPSVISEGSTLVGNDEESGSLPAVVHDDTRALRAWAEFVYHGADDRDKVILEHTLGLNGKPRLDNTNLAAKLKITPAAVSQRKALLQQQLDEYHHYKPW